jgi:hypothetical protein
VTASPSADLTFQWQFNNSVQQYDLPVREHPEVGLYGC